MQTIIKEALLASEESLALSLEDFLPMLASIEEHCNSLLSKFTPSKECYLDIYAINILALCKELRKASSKEAQSFFLQELQELARQIVYAFN